MSAGPLRIAVPRGALFAGTLDLLDRLGIDTAEVRSNDRKLLFAEAGIVTMRPSDVPTYVEHGSADLGITGKDVLLEQAQRNVYELLDLGFGECRMVVAAREGGDPIADALRRLGRVRIATKYPRIAAAYFADTGRQAEIVEVKGSVELAPLTGLVDGIVDLTATRPHARRERPQRARGDRGLHGAADRQSGGAQAEGARDRLAGAGGARLMRIVRDRIERPSPPPARAQEVHAILDAVRDGGDARRARPDRALRPRRAGAGRPAGGAARAGGGAGRAGAGGAARPAHRHRERAPGGARAAPRAGERGAARGPARRRGRAAAGPRGDLRARRPRSLSVDGGDGRRDGAGGGSPRDRGVRASRAGGSRAPGDPGRVRAVRGDRGLPDGRRPGDRRARLRDRERGAGGRDRGARQRLGDRGQASGLRARGDRRPGRPERAGGGGQPRAPTPS